MSYRGEPWNQRPISHFPYLLTVNHFALYGSSHGHPTYDYEKAASYSRRYEIKHLHMHWE